MFLELGNYNRRVLWGGIKRKELAEIKSQKCFNKGVNNCE